MRYSVILNGVEGAYALKKALEEASGKPLLSSDLEEHKGINTTCKFTFDTGSDDYKEVTALLQKANVPVNVVDSLREEVTTGNDY